MRRANIATISSLIVIIEPSIWRLRHGAEKFYISTIAPLSLITPAAVIVVNHLAGHAAISKAPGLKSQVFCLQLIPK